MCTYLCVLVNIKVNLTEILCEVVECMQHPCEVVECMQHPCDVSFHEYGKEIVSSRLASSILSGVHLFKEVFPLSASLVIVCNFLTSVVAL